MNFPDHILLSGENEDIQFGNFIGDFIKGNGYKKKYSEDIIKGILLHREIDSFTDTHPLVHKSIERMRPAYGKYAGVAVDILYDRFSAKNRTDYSQKNIEMFVADFHITILERTNILPRKARRFTFPFIRKKRLLCYARLNCYEEVLKKMSVFTSMPNKVKQAMKIITENYDLFYEDFKRFFPELSDFSKNFLSNKSMPQSNPKG